MNCNNNSDDDDEKTKMIWLSSISAICLAVWHDTGVSRTVGLLRRTDRRTDGTVYQYRALYTAHLWSWGWGEGVLCSKRCPLILTLILMTLTFLHNFGKCEPIYNFFLRKRAVYNDRDSHLNWQCVATVLCESKTINASYVTFYCRQIAMVLCGPR